MFSFVPHIERKCEKRLVPQLFSFSESESDFDDDIHNRDHLEPSRWSPFSVPEVPLPNSVFWSHLAVKCRPPNEPENRKAEAEPEGPEGVSMKMNLTLILQGPCSG